MGTGTWYIHRFMFLFFNVSTLTLIGKVIHSLECYPARQRGGETLRNMT